MNFFRRSLASLSLASFLLNPMAAYASIIPFANAEEVNIPTLLSASDYGITEPAQELPAERTLRTATFDLGNGKRAQVSVPSTLFTHHPEQPDTIVFTSSKGAQQENSFNFDYLPQDTRVSFDLTKPSYTLTKGEHSFTLSFPTQSSIAGTILNDHQVSYPLSENATLVWTVDGANVKKEIHVHNQSLALPTEDPPKADAGRFPFIIDSSLTKSLQNNSIILSNGSEKIFQTEKPYLLTTDYSPLLNSISVIQSASGQYEYVYDESSLPEEYILDPSAGPNGPGSAQNDSSNGGDHAWSNVNNILVDDGNATSVSGTLMSGESSHILKTYNYGFSIPTGSTIDGVLVTADISIVMPGYETQISKLLNDSRNPIGNNLELANTLTGGTYGTIYTAGGSSNTWGATLTPTIVNDADFGYAYAENYTEDFSGSINFGYVTITVYYTEASCDGSATLCPLGDASINLSGYLYSDLGVTGVVGKTIKIAKNGTYITEDTTEGAPTAGRFGFDALDYQAGDILTLYIDGDSNNAVTVFRTSTTDGNTNVHLYYNYLTLDSRNGSAFTNANLATATVSGENDITDIYTVSSGNVTMGSSTTLYLPASKAYTPGGNITTPGNINIAGTFTAGTNTVTLTGSNQTIKGNSSNVTFYNLTKTTGGGQTLTVDSNAGAVIVSNSLTLAGTSAGSKLTIADVGSSVFRLTSGGSQSLSYLSVANMSAAGGDELACNTSCTDGDGNINWSFGGGGGGGGGGDVPEFSTIGLLILLGGCYMMMKKNELIEG